MVRFFLLVLCLAPLTGCVALGIAGSLGAAATVGTIAATQAHEGRPEPNSSVRVYGPYNTFFADQFTVRVDLATTPEEAERVAHAAAEDHCAKRAEAVVVQGDEIRDKFSKLECGPLCWTDGWKKQEEHPYRHYIRFICKAVAP